MIYKLSFQTYEPSANTASRVYRLFPRSRLVYAGQKLEQGQTVRILRSQDLRSGWSELILAMKIGGLEKLSLLDYPGLLSAIVFTQGCNFRCRFCYNPMLVWPQQGGETLNTKKDDASISEHDLFVFLEERRGKLDGVVITGGEPTLHPDLPEFITKIRALGYQIKLDTNGTNLEMLKKLIDEGLVDYIAMDVKAAPGSYKEVVGVPIDWSRLAQSIGLIMSSGLPYEFRSTVAPDLHTRQDILEMAGLLKGAQKWYLQALISDVELVDPNFKGARGFKQAELTAMAKEAAAIAGFCQIRGFQN